MSNRKRKTSPDIALRDRRFTALAQRRSAAPQRYAALRRREGRDAAVIQTARQRLAAAGYRSQSSVKRVKLDGVPLGVQRPADPISHAVVAAVAIAFVLPLFFAFVGGKMMPPARFARHGWNRTPHVAGTALGGQREPGLRAWRPARIGSAQPGRLLVLHRGAHPTPRAPEGALRTTVSAPRRSTVRGPSVAARRTVENALAARPARPRATAPPRAEPTLEQRMAVVMRSIFLPASRPLRQPAVLGVRAGARSPQQLSSQRVGVSEAGRATIANVHPGGPKWQPRHLIAGAVRVRLALAPRPEAVPVPEHAGPWTLSPDGTWRTEIDAPPGARDVSFSASGGELVKLEPSVMRPDAATLDIGWSRSIRVVMTWAGHAAVKLLPAPDDQPEAFSAAARAVGPHLVQVGWTPLAAASGVGSYRILRSSMDGDPPEIVATVPAGLHAWQDRHVEPGAAYRYTVVAQAGDDPVQAATGVISTPPSLDAHPVASLRGKGMFLYFSTLPGDARNFHAYDPQAIVARARAADIRVIELRMARGTCPMAETPESGAWLNRLIDAAAQSGITLLAWTVPRRASTEDIAQSVAAAAYRTPEGHGFAGLALDLETGSNYMGDGPAAQKAMVAYAAAVRAALGPAYLLVAIVESPAMGHAGGDYPYASIARYASVLQPMEYWHYFNRSVHHDYEREEVAGAAARAVALLRALAGRDVAVDLAGQSVDLAGTGSPSGREIVWSLAAARGAGAIGEVFFDWAGTRPDGWAAIQAFDW